MEVVWFLILEPTLDPVLEIQIKTRLISHVLLSIRKSAFLLQKLCNPHEFTVILA
jgi:hypothetical protein